MSNPNSSTTAIISANNLVVDYGHHVVLDNATLAINENDRIGLIGRNGAGKSTFLKILNGEMEPDSGQVIRKRDLVVGYLPQKFNMKEDETVFQNIMTGVQDIQNLIKEYEDPNTTQARHDWLYERISHFEGWTIEQRAKILASHLNAPAPDRIVSSLSGGEKRRVALCRALLAQPDLLILDEPTNHLDTESIEWLEEFLIQYPGACLFVTHDRYFLDRIANRIVELSRGNFFSHVGTYTDYLENKATRESVEEQQEASRQKFLKRELEWYRRRPKARRTTSKDRVERFEIESAKEGPEVELDIDLIIPPAPKLANRVLELTNVAMTLPDSDRTLFKNLSFKIESGERIGIVGRNGLGKTTLLKILMGQQQPSTGKVDIGTQTRINYIDQARVLLDDNKTIVQEVSEGGDYVALGEEKVSVRGYLRRFLFSEDRINAKIGLLSGGERTRVILAKILKRGGNLLILDEPTNDLDLATLRLLEEAIVAFKGSVIAVSHDRYFLNRICTSILAFEGSPDLFYSVGNYDYYLEKRPSQKLEKEIQPENIKPPVSSKKETPRKLKWKEQKELETIEETIQANENEIIRIEDIFKDPDFYKKHGHEWQALTDQLAELKKKAQQLYTRWAELEDIKNASASGPAASS